ncbi:MAG: sigma-54 dependent transcriptional regulator [Pseudomonadota bacterium]
MERILIVDDDTGVLKVLAMRLESKGYGVTPAADIRQALSAAGETPFNLALVDLKLSKESGIDLMESLHELDPELPVIILTAYGTIGSAVEAMQRGAYSYITKPFDYHDLLLQIKNGLEKAELSKEVIRLKRIVKEDYEISGVIGKSESMNRVLDLISHAAQAHSNIFIHGESGTGKGLMAKILHQLSPRKDKPFVAINCAAIPETLLESELFGFEKGAFTGAHASKKGLFVQAHEGVLFLDEVCEIPLLMQGKLLKALEEKEFYPLGAQRPVKVDISIISASNKDIMKEVETGRFRSDLFYRIHVIPISIPPLRERREDIPLLTEHFLSRSAGKMKKKKVTGFSLGAMEKIMLYSWPGNVRELENIVECAVVMSNQEIITEDLIVLPTQRTEKNSFKPLKESKRDFERKYLMRLMEISRGNISQAARLAGKYRADLYELLGKHNIKAPGFRQE